MHCNDFIVMPSLQRTLGMVVLCGKLENSIFIKIKFPGFFVGKVMTVWCNKTNMYLQVRFTGPQPVKFPY